MNQKIKNIKDHLKKKAVIDFDKLPPPVFGSALPGYKPDIPDVPKPFVPKEDPSNAKTQYRRLQEYLGKQPGTNLSQNVSPPKISTPDVAKEIKSTPKGFRELSGQKKEVSEKAREWAKEKRIRDQKIGIKQRIRRGKSSVWTNREKARKKAREGRIKPNTPVSSPEQVQQVKETLRPRTPEAPSRPQPPTRPPSAVGPLTEIPAPAQTQSRPSYTRTPTGLPLANKLGLGALGLGGLGGAYYLSGGEMPSFGSSVPNIPPGADLASRMAPNAEMPSVDPSMLEEYGPWALGGAGALGAGYLVKQKLAQRLAAQRAAQANARLGNALKWGGLGLAGLGGLGYLMSGRDQNEQQ